MMNGFEHVSFSFGRKAVLRDLTFSAEEGMCVAFAGPNGVGKSTVLAIAAGLLRADSGAVTLPAPMGYIPQTSALFEDMSAGDNVRFFAKLQKQPVPERFCLPVEAYLNTRVSKLSGGAKKRVSIVCGLLGDPALVLMDEPCTSLDIPARDELMALVKELKSRGRMILYVGHEPAELEQVADRLVLLGSGRYRVAERSEFSGRTESVLRDWFSDQPETDIQNRRRSIKDS